MIKMSMGISGFLTGRPLPRISEVEMPTYEYRCKACGHAFEHMQPMSSPPLRTCPKCSKRKVERLISSGGGLIFKGSGFYVTDYRSQGYKDKAKADTEAAKPKETAPSKADAKPAPEKSKPEKAKTPAIDPASRRR